MFLHCVLLAGGEALVSCGMMESLLKVINWFGEGQEHITVSTLYITLIMNLSHILINKILTFPENIIDY